MITPCSEAKAHRLFTELSVGNCRDAARTDILERPVFLSVDRSGIWWMIDYAAPKE